MWLCVKLLQESICKLLTNLYENIWETTVKGGLQKEKDAWEAFGVHPSKKGKKKCIYTTLKKKSQQEKLLSA